MIDPKISLIIYILILGFYKFTLWFTDKYPSKSIIILLVSSVSVTLILSYLLSCNSLDRYTATEVKTDDSAYIPIFDREIHDPHYAENHRLLKITPGKVCKGGPFLHQGDSEEARFCQNMQEHNPNEIKQFTCGQGLINQPRTTDWKYETGIVPSTIV